MARTEWTDEQKATALAVIAAAKTLTEAQRLLSEQGLAIPYRTLANWQKSPPSVEAIAELGNEKKEELATTLDRIAERIGGQMLKAPLDEVPLQQLATSLAIVIDKSQILKGEPNAITRTETARTNEERAIRILELFESSADTKAG